MEIEWTETSDSKVFNTGGDRYVRLRRDVISKRSLTVEQLVYLAGFFDGEGSVGLYYHKKQNQWKARINIAQNDSRHALRLMSLWAEVFGGTVHKRKHGDLEMSILRRPSIMAFCKYVGPYTVLKRQQIVIIENWVQSRMYSLRMAQILKVLKRSAS